MTRTVPSSFEEGITFSHFIDSLFRGEAGGFYFCKNNFFPLRTLLFAADNRSNALNIIIPM